MSASEVLQRAIQAARAGQKLEARDLLLQVVEVDPRNELAWIWLSGLVDTLEDRIIACENVLTINPANTKVRAYLARLQEQYEAKLDSQNIDEAVYLFNQAKIHVEQKDMDSAIRLAKQALEKRVDYEDAWLLIGRISPDVDQQIMALEKAYQLNPSNVETVSALKQARYIKTNPIGKAAQLEQMGKFEEALRAYEELAGRAKDSQEFDYIYKQIIRIEGLQNEKIRYVAPGSSIVRLTFAWPLLYLSLTLIQTGINPFAHPMLYLWLGLPFVVLGSFLLSLAEVRSRHFVWQRFFDEHGDGSTFARFVTAVTGWFFVLIPHVLLVLDSLNRLRNFKIPPLLL
jgi:tetratricopeptide (TPR) repeat protein